MASFDEALRTEAAFAAWDEATRVADLVPVLLIARTAGSGKQTLVCLTGDDRQTDEEIVRIVCQMAENFKKGGVQIQTNARQFRQSLEEGGMR